MARVAILPFLLVPLLASTPSALAECRDDWVLADAPPGPRVWAEHATCARPGALAPVLDARVNATASEGLAGTHVEADVTIEGASELDPAAGRQREAAGALGAQTAADGYVPLRAEGDAHALFARTSDGCAYDIGVAEATSGVVGSFAGFAWAQPCPIRSEGWDPLPL